MGVLRPGRNRTGYRGGGDESPITRTLHVRESRPERPPGAVEVDVEHLVPGRVVEIRERYFPGNARVGDDDVHATELGDRPGDERVNIRSLGDDYGGGAKKAG